MTLLDAAIAAAKIGVVLVWVLLMIPILVWMERRVLADFQVRLGPNRVGPQGILQPIADGIKLLMKEDFTPATVDRIAHYVAPTIALIPALMTFAVIPFGDGPFVITRLNVGLLYVLGLGSLHVYSTVLAGWSSNNKYSLLGAVRSSAQMISYELAMGLSLIVVLMLAGTMDLVQIVQGGQVTLAGGATMPVGLGAFLQSVTEKHGALGWLLFKIPLVIAFLTYAICGLAETNRAPFDLPEAESELVAGFHTEYSSMRFAIFFMSEYANMLGVIALAITLFLGGWQPVIPAIPLPPVVWFMIKMFIGIYVFMWLRATFPRLRYDQLMNLGWTRLVPLSLVNIIITALLIGWHYGWFQFS